MQERTIIFGAPGCGKTYYLLNLLEDLLKKYKPHEIAFVSFTRKGAYEGRNKAMERFGYSADDFPYFKTLHSIAFAEAQLTRGDVIGKKNYKEFADAVGMQFTGYYTEDFTCGDDIYLFYYFLKKNNYVASELIELDFNMNTYEYVERAYDKYKRQKGLVDYTDMLTMFVNQGSALPVKVAIIDEAQDLTSLQWEMCEIAFRNCEHVYIAGDDDQAIYEWNGADVHHFLHLEGKRVILDKSYRMPSTILDFSKKISNMISERVDKKFSPNSIGGSILTYNDVGDVPIVEGETYYMLARNNCYLDRYTYHLQKKGLAYNEKGNPSVSEKTLKAIRGYEYFRKHGKYKDEIDALTVPRYLKKETDTREPWYSNFEMDIDTVEYYRALIANGIPKNFDDITVSTIHGVKGGEADNVIVLLDMTRRVDDNYDTNPDSELRCLYVACTRAKKKLHIVYSNGSNGYDNHMNINMMIGDVQNASKNV